MLRLVVYVLVTVAAIVTGSGLSLGNDEPIAAHLWRLPSLTLVGVFTIPLVVIVRSIVRTFQGSRKRTILHVIGLGLTTLFLGLLVGNVLDPWLFPRR
jgi:H+/Cl- antiporter ClcA